MVSLPLMEMKVVTLVVKSVRLSNVVIRRTLDITLTISGSGSLDNDDDPVCNYIAEVKINNPGSGWEVGDIVEFEIKDEKYKVTVTEIETVFTAQGVPVTPSQTPSDGSVVEASQILADLTAEFKQKVSRLVL